jgi:hypothetical protein
MRSKMFGGFAEELKQIFKKARQDWHVVKRYCTKSTL